MESIVPIPRKEIQLKDVVDIMTGVKDTLEAIGTSLIKVNEKVADGIEEQNDFEEDVEEKDDEVRRRSLLYYAGATVKPKFNKMKEKATVWWDKLRKNRIFESITGFLKDMSLSKIGGIIGVLLGLFILLKTGLLSTLLPMAAEVMSSLIKGLIEYLPTLFRFIKDMLLNMLPPLFASVFNAVFDMIGLGVDNPIRKLFTGLISKILPTILFIAMVFTKLFPIIMKVVGFIKWMIPVVTKGFAILKFIILGLSKAIALLSNPIGWAILAVGVLIGITVWAEKIKSFFMAIPKYVMMAFDWVTKYIPFLKYFRNLFSSIINFITVPFIGFLNIIIAIKDLWKSTESFNEFLLGLPKTLLLAVGRYLRTFVKAGLKIVKEIVMVIMTPLFTLFNWLMKFSFINRIIRTFVRIFNNVIKAFRTITGVFDGVVEEIRGIANTVSTIFKGISKTISGMFTNMLSNLMFHMLRIPGASIIFGSDATSRIKGLSQEQYVATQQIQSNLSDKGIDSDRVRSAVLSGNMSSLNEQEKAYAQQVTQAGGGNIQSEEQYNKAMLRAMETMAKQVQADRSHAMAKVFEGVNTGTLSRS